jgi:two-component system NarL family sensor kinase
MNFDALAPAQLGDTVDPEHFSEALQFLEQGITELRTTAQNILPSVLENEGLTAAIEVFCRKLNTLIPLHVDFQTTGVLPPLKEDFQLNIYRIVQELINNTVKHAKATQVMVRLEVQSKYLLISVEDNGIGIHPTNLQSKNGVGLFSLQNRLNVLRAQMNIVIANGTRISIKFALKKHLAK